MVAELVLGRAPPDPVGARSVGVALDVQNVSHHFDL